MLTTAGESITQSCKYFLIEINPCQVELFPSRDISDSRTSVWVVGEIHGVKGVSWPTPRSPGSQRVFYFISGMQTRPLAGPTLLLQNTFNAERFPSLLSGYRS